MKFLFIFENVAMRWKSDENMAPGLLGFLEKDAFEFYFDTFDIQGSLPHETKDCRSVKKPFKSFRKGRRA